MKLAIIYLVLALLAALMNVLTQAVAFYLYQGPYSLLGSLLLGTLVGLVFKYQLDKRYIFKFKAINASHDGQIFLLYSVMGVMTTAMFWATELSFHYWFASPEMRYVGAVLGLSVGYLSKYYLDKSYVFRTECIG